MPSLILEGGTLRPIFSAGIMDALLEEDVMFPYCIGVSAGITNGVSYISKQKGRNLEILMKYRLDKRYMGLRNYLTDHSMFGLDFVYRQIPESLVPFDYDTFQQYKGKFLIGATNAETGETEYFEGLGEEPENLTLRATCALPFFFPAITIDGKKFYDGGITDSIPVQKAIADGNEKHLIILTQPEGYRKHLTKSNQIAIRSLRHKYPKMAEAIANRPERYNETVAFCERLEQEGKALILRPEYPLKSREKNLQTIQNSYQHGCDMARKRMGEIRALFD